MTLITKKIMPIILISLLIPSVAAIASIQAVSASNAALLFTPNYISGDPPGEASYSDSVANMVYYYFYTYGSNYGYSYNCEDSSATVSNYMSTLSYAQNNFYNSVVYSKGHEVPYGDGNHYAILDHTGTYLDDYPNIYQSTGASDRFIFLWHCGTAMSYPTWWDTWNGGGYPGMAYDFTHNNGMHTDGYGSPDSGVYAYLGFIYYSQEYLTGTGYNNHYYGDFVTIFYQYLLQYHYSVNSALDAAAILTLGSTSFGSSQLHNPGIYTTGQCGSYYSKLVVYGDGNLGIPA